MHRDLVPDGYHVCADGKVCQDVEIAATPAVQRATLAAPGAQR